MTEAELKKIKKQEYNKRYYSRKKQETTESDDKVVAFRPKRGLSQATSSVRKSPLDAYREVTPVLLIPIILVIVCTLYLIYISQQFYQTFTSSINAWTWAILLEVAIGYLTFTQEETNLMSRFKVLLLFLLILATTFTIFAPAVTAFDTQKSREQLIAFTSSRVKDINDDIQYYAKKKDWPSKVSNLVRKREQVLDKKQQFLEDQLHSASSRSGFGTVRVLTLYRTLILLLNLFMIRKIKLSLKSKILNHMI